MIKSLEIKNYLSHKDSRLEFHPGVNVIVGASDAGKSAILRAMRWVTDNRPSGDKMRRWGGGETRVTLKTDTATVIRAKDKRDEYFLGGAEGTNLVLFKAFGTSVPSEVQTALNLSPLNTQRQLDSHFLLSDSPGVVAEHFNRIANLEKIDAGVRNINGHLMQLSGTVGKPSMEGKPATGLHKQLEDATTALIAFEGLEKFEIEVEVLEGMRANLITKIQSVKKFENLIAGITEAEEKIEAVQRILAPQEEVMEVLRLMEVKDENLGKYFSLKQLLQKINENEETQKGYRRLTRARVKVEEVSDLLVTYKANKNSQNELENKLYYISTTEEMIVDESRRVKAFKNTFEKEMPDICPLCNQLIPHNH